MADRSVRVILSAQIADFQAKMNAAKSSVDDFASRLDGNRQAVDTLANGLLTVGTVAAVGLGFAVKASADFEQAMSNVKATGQDAATNFDALRDAAIEMGAQTAFSATEAAAGVENLLKAGVSATDVLGGGLQGALDLAAAGTLQVGQAAEIAATALTQFGLSGADVPHVADLLAAAAGKAQGEVSDMGQALNQAGLVASQFGLSIEETVGGLAAFASAGLLGSDAGTSLKTMLQRLAAPSKEAAAEMKALGIAAYDSQGQFVGLEGLAGQLQASLTKLTPAQRDAAMATIFGADAVRAANVLYKEGATGIAGWTTAVNDQGFAAETAATKLDNLKGDVEAFGGALESVLIDSGSGANEALRGLTQGATDAVNAFGNLPAPVISAGAGLTALVAAGGLAAGGLLKAYTTARDLHSAFRDLVPAGSALDGKLRGVGVAAGVAGAALGLIAVGSLIEGMNRLAVSVGDAQTALERIRESSTALDSLFEGVDDYYSSAQTFEGALKLYADGIGTLREGIQSLTGMGDLVAVRGQFEALDAALTKMDPAEAAAGFERIGATAVQAGVPVEKLAQIFPQYAASLQESARAAGQSVTASEAVAAALGDVAATAALVPADVPITVTATGITEVQAMVAELQTSIDGSEATVTINGDPMPAQEIAATVLASIDAATGTVTINGNPVPAGDALNTIIGLVNSGQGTITIEGNNAPAVSETDAAVARMNASTGTVTISGNAGPANAATDGAVGKANSSTGTISVSANAAAANAAIDNAARPRSTTITVTTVMRNAVASGSGGGGGWADGALLSSSPLGLVQTYASGGLHAPAIGGQSPQIRAAGGRGILWAEDGAGPWEGFVSGHPGKRGRSRVITEEIARRLGGDVQWHRAFADGGFMGDGGRASSSSASPGFDYERLTKAVRAGFTGLPVHLKGVSLIADAVAGVIADEVEAMP